MNTRVCSSLFSTQKAALAVCDLLLNRIEGTTKKITEMEESALKELANIVVGNFLTPFAHSLLTDAMMHSPAVYENDSSTEIMKHARALLTQTIGTDSAIKIAFGYEHADIKGDINIVLEADKINSLLQQMMVYSNG